MAFIFAFALNSFRALRALSGAGSNPSTPTTPTPDTGTTVDFSEMDFAIEDFG